MLRQFFTDDAGQFSCMRLMTFCVLAMVLGVWGYCNVCSGMYVPMGYDEAGVISTAIIGKAAQARFEYGTPANGMADPPITAGGVPCG